ncbi:hypothetical protein A2U01_0056149, partial [Trifolium medium]|nr:hypothetical protein [Trifolium medium]
MSVLSMSKSLLLNSPLTRVQVLPKPTPRVSPPFLLSPLIHLRETAQPSAQSLQHHSAK